jgi:hypothetical protein
MSWGGKNGHRGERKSYFFPSRILQIAVTSQARQKYWWGKNMFFFPHLHIFLALSEDGPVKAWPEGEKYGHRGKKYRLYFPPVEFLNSNQPSKWKIFGLRGKNMIFFPSHSYFFPVGHNFMDHCCCTFFLSLSLPFRGLYIGNIPPRGGGGEKYGPWNWGGKNMIKNNTRQQKKR